MSNSQLIWQQPEVIHWSQCLLNSYEKYLGKSLIPRCGDRQLEAKTLFLVPFVVLSHNTEADPILNYGNQVALKLWEMSWAQLTQTPSHLTAEPMNRQERQEMLSLAAKQGYIANYQGVRISKTGKRFWVEKAIIWNLEDASGKLCGQGATFPHWSYC